MRIKIFSKTTDSINQICTLLAQGKIIALPTETAYGLAADSTNKLAVNKINRLKGRKANQPIALMAGDIDMVSKFFYLLGRKKKLARKFWPGPLTILLKPRYSFPKIIIGVGGLVGVRVPGNSWLRKLISDYGKPLTATSANLTGEPTIYDSTAVKKFLKKINLEYLVDGGRLPYRPTSTVVKINGSRTKILRPGAVTEQIIKHVLS